MFAERLMSWCSMKLTQRHARASGPQIRQPRASIVNSSRKATSEAPATVKEYAACPHHTQIEGGTSRRDVESPNELARPERQEQCGVNAPSRMSGPARKILLATDLSARCDRALYRAAMLAKQWQSSLIVLHVVEDRRLEHSGCSRTAVVETPARSA